MAVINACNVSPQYLLITNAEFDHLSNVVPVFTSEDKNLEIDPATQKYIG